MKNRFICSITTLLLGAGLFFWIQSRQRSTSIRRNQISAQNQSIIKPPFETQATAKETFVPPELEIKNRFSTWKLELQVPVNFTNPPKIDSEGLFCVINPEYKFGGKQVTEIVEDGYWYHHSLSGAGGAILFGKGNGRPPWSHKLAQLYVENNELKFRHRISFGGSKGVRSRLLLDLNEKLVVTKIGMAFDERVPGSPWGYSAIVADEMSITAEEIEKTPVVQLKSNWIEIDTEFNVAKTFSGPVRVIWLQFQNEGKNIVKINN